MGKKKEKKKAAPIIVTEENVKKEPCTWQELISNDALLLLFRGTVCTRYCT